MSIDLSGIIDVKVAVVLWGLGFFLKHSTWKPIKHTSNTIIPVILAGIGVLLSCILAGDVTFNSILIGFTTAMFTIGIHSSGKNIFKFAQDTTVYVTPDSITNSVAKNEGDRIQAEKEAAVIEEAAKVQSTPTTMTNHANDDIVIDDNEIIIDDGRGL